MLVVYDIDTKDREAAAKLLCAQAELLAPTAARDIKANKVPPLYKSGVKYHRQNPRACAFRLPSDVRSRKHGDCKQLVLWRLGELLNAGEKATARVLWINNKTGLQAHILIRRADGNLEDPSVALGMKGVNNG
jgi:hypothetical protein